MSEQSFAEAEGGPFGRRQRIGLFAGLVAAALMLAMAPPAGMTEAGWRVAAVGALMAIWWITEAIPVYATALLPVALFPALGLMDLRVAAAPYAQPTIFLFMGGFMIALAMQRWNLHRRIALGILSRTGTGPRQLVGGMLIATVLISMWISNTSTALMMLPIATSILVLIRTAGGGARDAANIGPCLALAVGYGATIGGIGTPIGTPPNALMVAFMQSNYGIAVSFSSWMMVGVPLLTVLAIACWFLLCRVLYPLSATPIPGAAALINSERAALGPMQRGEIVVAAAFTLAALMWITQPMLTAAVPALKITDAGIAMTIALALFLIPTDFKRGEFVLNWEWASRIPWGILVLFGGGLSLAEAAATSGLAEWIGSGFASWQAVPAWVIVLALVAFIVFLSEIASNTAAAATLLPLLAVAAVTLGQNPMLFCVAGALAASGGFMLPVATPPNAIVFGSGAVTINQMARAGFWLDLVWVVVVGAGAVVLLPLFFDLQYGVVPDWALKKP